MKTIHRMGNKCLQVIEWSCSWYSKQKEFLHNKTLNWKN